MLAELIKVLKDESPFAMLERDGAITQELIKIYSTLKSDIEAGEVKTLEISYGSKTTR